MKLIDPDPFNHGTFSLRFKRCTKIQTGGLQDLVHSGWGIQVLSARHILHSGDKKSKNIYLLRSATGGYVLKRRGFDDGKSFERTLKYLDLASQSSLPVPKFYPTINKEMYLNHKDGLYTLEKLAIGKHFNGSRVQLKNAARGLARLHIAYSGLTADSFISTDFKEIYPFPDKGEIGIINKLIPETINILEFYQDNKTEVGSLPRQLGHYDYHPHNLLFDSRNKLTAILDFDLMRVSQRARDVALAMHKLARVYGSQTEAKLDIGATILDRATDFLSAYQQLFPLAKHEVISMPHLLRDEVIRKIAYLCMTKNSLDRYSLQELKKQETQFWETMEFGSLWSRMLKYENK